MEADAEVMTAMVMMVMMMMMRHQQPFSTF
jgi:hypothetical protein